MYGIGFGIGAIGATTKRSSGVAFNYLLDTYSGSSVAYSLRKLSSTYSGSCIRVRRSLDNSEQDIGFVSNVLDTASLLSFVGSSDGYVVTIYDQSGNGNNAIQSYASYQQKIVSLGNLILDGSNPCLDGYCNGSVKFGYHLTTEVSYKSSFTVAHVLNTSIVNYFSSRETSPFSGVAWGNNFSGNSDKFYHRSQDIFLYEIYTNGRTLNRSLLSDSLRSSKLYTSVNSSSETDKGTYNSSQSINYVIGREQESVPGLQFQGLFQEFIAFSVDNSANISSIKSQINTFYGIY